MGRRAIVAWLLNVVLALHLAAPAAAMPRVPTDAAVRLAALAIVVGHPVATCHDDEGQMPDGDAGPCCPCVLCHALTAGCLIAPVAFDLAQPIASNGGLASYPQPPPRAPAFALGLSGPRGPPTLA